MSSSLSSIHLFLFRSLFLLFFFFNDTATTEIYTLSLHDALPILPAATPARTPSASLLVRKRDRLSTRTGQSAKRSTRSEEHTSELQSPDHLVCRLLLEKKKNIQYYNKRSQHSTSMTITLFLVIGS